MGKIVKLLICIVSLSTLSACMEGYQVVYTKDLGSGDGRTAGSRVVYVRGGLMPPKSLSLKALSEDTQIASTIKIEDEKVKEETLEQVFLNRQKK